MRKKSAPPGYRWVYCRWYTNRRTGKRVYPRSGKVFAFLVPE